MYNIFRLNGVLFDGFGMETEILGEISICEASSYRILANRLKSSVWAKITGMPGSLGIAPVGWL
ncbi:MAG: hypothetical protein OJF51_003321 [Nitrospira sp.]|jgi:hypothetical protein|nr:MAG: hypothetical protein OJF51_003321 [Nitrospira sp.]